MVWSGICLKVVNGALNADGYIRNVRKKLFANAPQCPPSEGLLCLRLFECRRNKNNPIEHVWDMLGRRLRSITPAVQNPEQVAAVLVEIWDNLSQDMIDNVIRSMRRQMTAVIRARY